MDFLGIDHVIFGSSDLKHSARYFSDWGLKKIHHTKKELIFEALNGSKVFIIDEKSKSITAKIASHQQFREVVFGVGKKSDLHQIAKELSQDRDVSIDQRGVVHTTDDSGINIGFCLSSIRVRPPREATRWNSPSERKRVDTVSLTYTQARPHQIGHIVFFVPDTQLAEKFYRNRLGFWLSDRYVGGAGVFLRWAKKSEHHNLFFVKSRTEQTSLHHIAFEVNDIHEVFGGGVAFSKKGWPTEVGPGRHPISSAYFWYFKNPLGGAIEYFCDADFVTEQWKPHQYRVNRFSEWHLGDGIHQPDDGKFRPSLKSVKEVSDR